MTRTLLLILALVLSTSAIGRAESFLGRTAIRTTFQSDIWQSTLQDARLFLTIGDTSGFVEISKDDIAWQNRLERYRSAFHSFGLDVSREVARGLEISVGGGYAIARLETREVGMGGTDRVVENLVNTRDPGYYFGGGLRYRLNLYRRLFLTVTPTLSYAVLNSANYVDPQNDDIPTGYSLQKSVLKEDVLTGRASLAVGLDLGRVVPYAGGCLQVYRHHVAHDQTFLDQTGETIIHDEELYFVPAFWAAGIAGATVRISPLIRLTVEGSLGRGFSVTSRLDVGL